MVVRVQEIAHSNQGMESFYSTATGYSKNGNPNLFVVVVHCSTVYNSQDMEATKSVPIENIQNQN